MAFQQIGEQRGALEPYKFDHGGWGDEHNMEDICI